VAPSSLVDLIDLVPLALNYTGKRTLIEFTVDHHSFHELKSNPPGLRVVLTIKRMFLYHLANTYIPTTCLIIIVELTLFVDDSHFDTNVMVSLTTLLVMYTLYQSISTTLPQTGYLKLLDYWLLFSLVTPFILFCVHVLKKFYGKRSEVGWIQTKTHFCSMRKCSSRCFIITATLSFKVIYWTIAIILYSSKSGRKALQSH